MRLRGTSDGRGGFTLVELIVVVAIMSVLAALVASAVMRFAGQQQEENSKTTIAKAYGQLIRQWRATIELAQQEANPSGLNKLPQGLMVLAGNDPFRAKVIWTKLRLRQLFPMNYAEIQSGPSFGPSYSGLDAALAPPDSYQKALAGYSGSTHDPKTESAACLLIALTARANKGKELNQEDFSNLEIKDTDGDGVPELVDGWARPIRFYRWPTGCADVDALNPGDLGSATSLQTRFRDPQDSDGLLLQTTTGSDGWYGSTQRTDFEQQCHVVANPAFPPPPLHSFYLIPVIVSAGADGKFGIQQPSPGAPDPMTVPITNTGDPEYSKGLDKDNVWSFRIVTR